MTKTILTLLVTGVFSPIGERTACADPHIPDGYLGGPAETSFALDERRCFVCVCNASGCVCREVPC